jgi:hypothetical protein
MTGYVYFFMHEILMRYPITLDSLENGLEYYFEVKKKGSVLQIIFIECNFYRNRQLIAAIDLRWA